MRVMRYGSVIILCLLIAGCISRPYEITVPEKRYQIKENAAWGKKSTGWVKAKDEWSDTFSVLAPDGTWSFWGPYGWGGGIFRGGPEDDAGRYVGYEIRMLIRPFDLAEHQARMSKQGITGSLADRSATQHYEIEMEALRSGDFEAYLDKLREMADQKHERWRRVRGHPVPDEYSIGLVELKGMTCRTYEDRTHKFSWSEALRDKGPGMEEYALSITCPGFFNGGMARFVVGMTVRIDNMHKIDGIDIDHHAVLDDIKRRVQRSLDSLQFNGEFTQIVPEGYRR